MPASENAAAPQMHYAVRIPSVPTCISIDGGVVTEVRRAPRIVAANIMCNPTPPEPAPARCPHGRTCAMALICLFVVLAGWAATGPTMRMLN